MWNYIVSNQSESFSKKHLFLSKDGELPIGSVGEKGKRFIENMARYLTGNRSRLA